MSVLRGQIRLPGGALPYWADFEAIIDGSSQSPEPAPPSALPEGYMTDTNVALNMVLSTAGRHGISAVGVQRHGREFATWLNEDWPGLDVYAHRVTDAIMWPGFGSVDITINSGLDGFYFRPDGYGSYGEGR